jgi:hypothetical protein
MQQIILGSLVRQAKGTELLCQLLREEYSLLRAGEPDRVAALEMSIQDLIRQLVREREALTGRLRVEGLDSLAVFLEKLWLPQTGGFLKPGGPGSSPTSRTVASWLPSMPIWPWPCGSRAGCCCAIFKIRSRPGNATPIPPRGRGRTARQRRRWCAGGSDARHRIPLQHREEIPFRQPGGHRGRRQQHFQRQYSRVQPPGRALRGRLLHQLYSGPAWNRRQCSRSHPLFR